MPPAPSLNYLTNTGIVIAETNKKSEENSLFGKFESEDKSESKKNEAKSENKLEKSLFENVSEEKEESKSLFGEQSNNENKESSVAKSSAKVEEKNSEKSLFGSESITKSEEKSKSKRFKSECKDRKS